MAQFTLTSLDGRVACVCVSGEYDLADRREARLVFRHVSETDPDAVLVDLSECGFIDTAGLRVLADARDQATGLGKGFAVVDSHLQVERFLRVLGYHQEFGIVGTQEEALERLSGRGRRFVIRDTRTPEPAGTAI